MKVETNHEILYFVTVKIEAKTQLGISTGTGFFFRYDVGDQQYPFIVTNRHVVEGALSTTFTFHRDEGGKPVLGNSVPVVVEGDGMSLWFNHPDVNVDLAVYPLEPLRQHTAKHGNNTFCSIISESMIPSAFDISSLNALEEILFVGYPNGVWDSRNFLPVVRRGTNASPLSVDFDGKPQFIIDASVFGGSSGSPAFIVNHGSFIDRNGNTNFGSRIYFLGVVSAVFFKKNVAEVVSIPIPTNTVGLVEQAEMIDLGIVIKARKVVETIEHFCKKHGHEIKPA